jgi:hypothetical protein
MLWPAFSGRAGPAQEREIGTSHEPGSWSSAAPEAPAIVRSAAKRIIFLNRFFFPDHSATSRMLTDLAFHLAGCGIEERVVTSRQRYDHPDTCLPESDCVGGVAVYRISTTRFGRSALIGRGFDYGSFYTAVARSVLAWSKPKEF